MVATEAEDDDLAAHIVIGLATPMIVATIYMAELHIMLIWLNLRILLCLRLEIRALPQGAHPHLRKSALRPTSMRITFASLKQPNLHLLHMLLKPVMPMLVLHIPPHLVYGLSILEPLIISLIIRILFLLLLSLHLDP